MVCMANGFSKNSFKKNSSDFTRDVKEREKEAESGKERERDRERREEDRKREIEKRTEKDRIERKA